MKRRILCTLFAAALAIGLSACEESPSKKADGKTQISMMYYSQIPAFEALVESVYDDIDLVVEQNTLATLDSESERRLKNNNGSDLITTTLPGGVVSQYTCDLSAEDFVVNYSNSMIKQLLINGQTRYVPLPEQYFGYIVNETLIKELGFELPQNNQDIYEILTAAKEQGKGVGVNGDCMGFYSIGENYLANMIFGNFVPDFLSTTEGIIWLSELQEGKTTFLGHFEPSMDFLLHCVDNGYFDSGTVLSSNSVTSANKNAVHVKERMLDRSMVLVYGDTEFLKEVSSESKGDRFTMIPFLSHTDRPGWLLSIGNGFMAVNKALEAEGQEKKLEAALRILDLLSTEEGQKAWMADTDAVVSYLQDGGTMVENVPKDIAETVANGYVFNATVPTNLAKYFGRQMNMVISGKSTLTEAMAAVDNYRKTGIDSIEQVQNIVGSVAGDLLYKDYNTRREETALGNLIADAAREYAKADLALVNGGGIRSSLYEGEVWDADLAAVCPYSNLIISVELTGKTLKEALANGITQTDRGENIPGGRFLQVSGICYTFRPMKDENDTGELLEVTLPDGTPIDDEKTYVAAITDYMAGASSYAEGNGDGFVMLNVYDENEEKNVTLVSETGGTFRDALKAYFANRQGEAVSVRTEGRITRVQ